MYRGPLSDSAYRGHFSGHETFPLRNLWLRKAYDAVSSEPGGVSKDVFSGADAIVRFGVGKNMVSSIRHWALVCQVIREAEGRFEATDLGHYLFGPSGKDPYLDEPTTLWLLHWMMAGVPSRTTTWYYAFNYYTSQTFDRDSLATALLELCQERGWKRTSKNTIRRDVECFVRSYVLKSDKKVSDDVIEPVLNELGLVRSVGSSSFEFRRGPKPSLPDGLFNYALWDYWEREIGSQQTLNVERIAFDPGSPGRVFKLDENSLIERLSRIGETSANVFEWTDSAGIRAVSRMPTSGHVSPLNFLDHSYSPVLVRKAA